ncbi:hypothetical protein [uncultured Tateyamaria sp.]|uniref:hypothetical protein n=1 Tax=uncultured Tateyamaria sp. TaxID=455651 RepID=UPI00260A9DD5|nr:hypothetical protein [uncultured Tateyamaria sp.]
MCATLIVGLACSGCAAPVLMATTAVTAGASATAVGQHQPEGSPLREFSDGVRQAVTGKPTPTSAERACYNRVRQQAYSQGLNPAQASARVQSQC